MAALILHASRARAVRLAFSSAALAAASAFMARGIDESSLRGAGRLLLGGGRGVVIGWIGVVFFGLGVLAALRMALQRGPRLTIDERGVTDHALGDEPVVRWPEVRDVALVHVQRQPMLGLDLVDEERYLARLSTWRRRAAQSNRAFGFATCTISLAGLDAEPEAIADAVRREWRASESAARGPRGTDARAPEPLHDGPSSR